jgi:TolB protein
MSRDAFIAGRFWLALLISGVAAMSAGTAHAGGQAQALGLFQAESDIGDVVPAGSAQYDANRHVYTIESAGSNTWYHVDHFNYLWTRASGDIALTARISFPPHSYSHDPNPHRKGVLMFRQSLAPGSAYVDAALHGVGLTALQYRREQGANTPDIELTIDAPQTLRLEKRGDVFTLYVSQAGEPLQQVGASIRVHLRAPFYVGLGALSHDPQTTDVIEFSHVSLEPLKPVSARAKRTLYSTLQTIEFTDQYRRAVVIRTMPAYMQSADWTPDGKLLAVSCAKVSGGLHQVYLLPAGEGGVPRQLTEGAVASYFHAWSPDGKIVAFTRGSASRADLFTIPVAGGPETRLTHDTVNDGPVYSPDSQYIYFDSSRSGTLQIWRMRADGSQAEQMTDDDFQNSSPHISPDGATLAFLSQPHGQSSGFGPAVLRVMRFDDGSDPEHRGA